MRILIENGSYHLRNYGDVAMLQAVVSRMNMLWPGAFIEIITSEPDRLNKYCPGTHALLARGRALWFQDRNLFGPVHRLVPKSASRRMADMEGALRYRWPSLAYPWVHMVLKLQGISTAAMQTFLGALYKADLVVACGGGYITDLFKEHAVRVLDTLGMAIRAGIPTAMVGQGIGPVHNETLRARMKAVLPLMEFISLRENRYGSAFIGSLGIKPDQVAITGDDAVEMVYNARAAEPGNGIGVNLRMAAYAEVDHHTADRVRATVQRVARKHGLPLIPVPISLHETESDARTIQQLLTGYRDASDGGESLDTPRKVVRQIGSCRVVVTGSYHGAVFALAQGIPAIGLAGSPYYVSKFLGLSDQFDGNFEVIFLNSEAFDMKLSAAIEKALRSAEEIRPKLLAAAQRQIADAQAAYRNIYSLVESRKNKNSPLR